MSSIADQYLPPRRAALAASKKFREQQNAGKRSKPPPADLSPTESDATSELTELSDEETSKKDLVKETATKETWTAQLQGQDEVSTSATKSKKPKRLPPRSRTQVEQQPIPSSTSIPWPSPALPHSNASSPLSSLPSSPVKRKAKQTHPQLSPSKRTRTTSYGGRDNRITDLLSSDGVAFVTIESPNWTVESLSEFIFVRIGEDGNVLAYEEQLDNPPGYWWPARVTSKGERDKPMTVDLYEDDGYGSQRGLLCAQPSCRCIRSWMEVNGSSFIQGTFKAGRLEPRLLKSRWRTANTAMQKDIGLPALDGVSGSPVSKSHNPKSDEIFSIDASASKTSTRTRKQTQKTDPRDLENEADATLQIPGETVFARESDKPNSLYWPARILDFSARDLSNPKDFPGYLVQFFDDPERHQKIRRSAFCTSLEDRFLTCKLGKWHTDVADNHIPREDNAISRPPTPSEVQTSSLQILSSTKFQELTIYEQVQYIRPVLHLIIQGKYVPALNDHLSFLDGGEERKKVAQTAGEEGGFSKGELENIRYEVLRWALREERRGPSLPDTMNEVSAANDKLGSEVNGMPAVEVTSTNGLVEQPEKEVSQPPMAPPAILNVRYPRPRGDEGYEALSRSDRLQYGTDLLQRYALIQLLMWRDGLRESFDLLPTEEEKKLHSIAAHKLSLGNWWLDLVYLREGMILRQNGRQSPSVRLGSGRSRR